MATETPTKTYVVQPGQTLSLHGRHYNAGDEIPLTDADAKILGRSILEKGVAGPTSSQPGSPASPMTPAPPASAGTGVPATFPPGTPGNPNPK